MKRNLGEGEFVGLSFVVNDGSVTEVIRINSSMPENQTGNFSLKFISLNASRVKKISVTPIFLDEDGLEVIGNVKDEYITPNTCSNYCPSGAQCGVNGCGMNCGSGCGSGYLCLNYKCIKQQSSSGGGGGGVLVEVLIAVMIQVKMKKTIKKMKQFVHLQLVLH